MKKSRSVYFFLLCFFSILLFRPPFSFPSETVQVADMTITIVAQNGGQTASKGKIYIDGTKIRFEPEGEDGTGYLSEEIDLYDFGRREWIRLFTTDRIYFESRLPPARIAQAIQEGWIAATGKFSEKRIFLREGFVRGKAARLFLAILEEGIGTTQLKGRRDYSLRWISDDAAPPLQVIYPAADNETVIVDYDRRQSIPSNPKLFQPPAGFLSVNPY